MKRIALALCTASIIVCSILTPVTIHAEGCTHQFSATYEGPHSYQKTHLYVFGYNAYGDQIYGTCYILRSEYGCYPRCINCGFIDYENPYWISIWSETHGDCGSGTVSGHN